jgi:hypothetical protein
VVGPICFSSKVCPLVAILIWDTLCTETKQSLAELDGTIAPELIGCKLTSSPPGQRELYMKRTDIRRPHIKIGEGGGKSIAVWQSPRLLVI